MNRVPATLLVIASLYTVPALASHPSFDCSKASHEAEKIICKSPELAALDRNLAELYATVLDNTPKSAQAALKTEQRGWVKGRDDCWKATDPQACIKSEYEMRIRELKDR